MSADAFLNLPLAEMSTFARAMVTAGAVAVACGTLSVVIVLRRWALIGEAVAHAGFGGIGTAFLVALAVPALAGSGATYAIAITFCIVTALSIGYVTRPRGAGEEPFGADSAIGIFLVASVAWGLISISIYNRHTGGAGDESSADRFLFGTLELASYQTMLAGCAVSAAVVLTVWALFKEILYYTFDPLMAEVSGVRVRVVHGVLMLLMALVIVIGMRVAGNVLVTALLILPGATALLLSRRLPVVMGIAIVAATVGALAGVALNHYAWPFLPSGPVMVLAMFVEFIAAYGISRLRRKSSTDA